MANQKVLWLLGDCVLPPHYVIKYGVDTIKDPVISPDNPRYVDFIICIGCRCSTIFTGMRCEIGFNIVGSCECLQRMVDMLRNIITIGILSYMKSFEFI
jgi:hypothetical protein